MKIKLKLGVSEEGKKLSITLDDLGITQEEWDKLSTTGKNSTLNSYVSDLPENPYWYLESFEEIN